MLLLLVGYMFCWYDCNIRKENPLDTIDPNVIGFADKNEMELGNRPLCVSSHKPGSEKLSCVYLKGQRRVS